MFNSELLVKSQEGYGSEFFFTLEMQINQEARLFTNEENHEKLPSLEGTRVLIAEDNRVNMAVVRRFMQKWGVEVTEAVNGRDAVEKFGKGAYHLMLIDLEMPEMDGPTALKEIRKINRTVPAIAFTAAVYDHMESDLAAKGFADYIRKPFRPEDLHQKIR